jgi:1,4-alpha-glucan branching enzyme
LSQVHSHISSNVDDGLAGFDLGQPEEANYFKQVRAGAWQLGLERLLTLLQRRATVLCSQVL